MVQSNIKPFLPDSGWTVIHLYGDFFHIEAYLVAGACPIKCTIISGNNLKTQVVTCLLPCYRPEVQLAHFPVACYWDTIRFPLADFLWLTGERASLIAITRLRTADGRVTSACRRQKPKTGDDACRSHSCCGCDADSVRCLSTTAACVKA
jgi:hypothetical protein